MCEDALGFTLGALKSFIYCSSNFSISNTFSFGYKNYLHVDRGTCACLWRAIQITVPTPTFKTYCLSFILIDTSQPTSLML